jgi:hypothetical protein
MTLLRSRATAFVLTPISPTAAAAALTHPLATVRVADAYPGYPCRSCLRDAEVGDSLTLTTFNPFEGSSAYSQPGPIFLHADGCRPYPQIGRIPAQLLRRDLSVRAFDDAHVMVEARLTPGTGLEAVATALFADDRVAYLHVHNAAAGCWAVRIDRT